MVEKAVYVIRVKKCREQAEKIFEQIDNLMIWLENLFPSIKVEV